MPSEDGRVRFHFDGRELFTTKGAMLSMALQENGIRIGNFSFRLREWRNENHAFKDFPSVWMTVNGVPNLNPFRIRVAENMVVKSQTKRRVLNSLTKNSGAGFYYHMFTRSSILRRAMFKAIKKSNDEGGELSAEPGSAETFLRFEQSQQIALNMLIIGAGLAGFSAAMMIGPHEECSIAMIDALPIDRIRDNFTSFQSAIEDMGRRNGRVLIQDTPDLEGFLAARKIELYPSTTFIGHYEDNLFVCLQRDVKLLMLRPKVTIIAAGSEEVKPIFPGNYLPGVVTSEAYLLECQVQLHVKESVLFVDYDWTVPYLRKLTGKLRPGTVIVSRQASDGAEGEIVPPNIAEETRLLIGDVTAIERRNDRLLVSVITEKGELRIECDMLVTTGRIQPRVETTRLLSLQHETDTSSPVPLDIVGDEMKLGEGIYACGSVIGDSGMSTVAGGLIAGLSASRILGFTAGLDLRIGELTAFRKGEKSFPKRSRQITVARPDAVICPCLDVTAGDMSRAFAEGYNTLNLIKRHTGLFTGSCQGARCLRNAIEIYRSLGGEMVDLPTARPPLVSVFLGALAEADLGEDHSEK